MTAVGVKNGEPTFAQTAFLVENAEVLLSDTARWYKLPDAEWLNQIELSDELVGREETKQVKDERERAVLMGIENTESLEELRRLAETAGAEVVGAFLQKRDKPDGAMFIGKGRAEELARDCHGGGGRLPAEARQARRGDVHRQGPGGGTGPGLPGAGGGRMHFR